MKRKNLNTTLLFFTLFVGIGVFGGSVIQNVFAAPLAPLIGSLIIDESDGMEFIKGQRINIEDRGFALVSGGTAISIDAHNVCREASSTGGRHLFVPTNQDFEWEAFLGATGDPDPGENTVDKYKQVNKSRRSVKDVELSMCSESCNMDYTAGCTKVFDGKIDAIGRTITGTGAALMLSRKNNINANGKGHGMEISMPVDSVVKIKNGANVKDDLHIHIDSSSGSIQGNTPELFAFRPSDGFGGYRAYNAATEAVRCENDFSCGGVCTETMDQQIQWPLDAGDYLKFRGEDGGKPGIIDGIEVWECGGSCRGVPLANTEICDFDDTGVVTNTNVKLVSSCTDARKCEYQCTPGFNEFRGACVVAGVCLEPPIANSSVCPGSNESLTVDLPRTAVDAGSCGVGKCEYYCIDGYDRIGGSCVVQACTNQFEASAVSSGCSGQTRWNSVTISKTDFTYIDSLGNPGTLPEDRLVPFPFATIRPQDIDSLSFSVMLLGVSGLPVYIEGPQYVMYNSTRRKGRGPTNIFYIKGDIDDYGAMFTSDCDCNPDYLRNTLGLPYDGTTNNIAAKAVFYNHCYPSGFCEDFLDSIQVWSCAPDNDGPAGLSSLNVTVNMELNMCWADGGGFYLR
ncbi:MAG: hypothetical protein ACI9E5_000537 [Candidatus Omnitrophota bacterium]|jgi:hypothetical protein